MWIDRRWWMPGIAASLLLNVFLTGIIAGHLYARGGPPSDKGMLVPPAHVRALPPDEKKRFLAVMAAHKVAIQAARRAHQAARHAVEADIAAPVYDQARLTAAFATLRQAGVDLQEQAHDALVEALGVLSPASRATVVAHAPNAAEDPR